MKVVLVSTNLVGGAGGATRRLHEGLRAVGVDSIAVTREPLADVPGLVPAQARFGTSYAVARRNLDRLPKLLYRRRVPERSFDPQWVPDRVPSSVARLSPDVVNVHWVCNAFTSVGSIARLPRPVVWTLHDMWPLTGGCVYSEDCDRYKHACGSCPVLGSTRDGDLSHRTWMRKAKAWKNLDLTIVTPSSWLADCARQSSLFRERRVERIPYGRDLARFSPQDRARARRAFDLPPDAPLVLFGAWGDPRRKGGDLLETALGRLATEGRPPGMQVVTCGRGGALTIPGLPSTHVGHLEDDALMAQLYSAADVTVVPSTAEALGLAALESIACGTPVVAFDAATGLPDVVDHRRNGYLARAFDPEDLAQGIAWVVEDRARHAMLSKNAREKAEREFSIERHVRSYITLFEELLAQKASGERNRG